STPAHAPRHTVETKRPQGLLLILDTIGEGQFAKVKLAQHVLTKEVVAIKVIQKTNQKINSLKTISHPNIVKLLEVIDTEEALFIVMEYVSGGDLSTYLEAKGRLTEGEARGLFRQLVSALQHCHQRGVVHRDLKLGNLLLDANNNAKISDFSLSNHGKSLKEPPASRMCLMRKAPPLLGNPRICPSHSLWPHPEKEGGGWENLEMAL
uniref:non-specific serine/threonine protein kinase n=1 Tax=Bos indicus x Bos taurus TaxID=30522 RepID=A0A4W2CF11_BOBOX